VDSFLDNKVDARADLFSFSLSFYPSLLFFRFLFSIWSIRLYFRRDLNGILPSLSLLFPLAGIG